MTASEEPMASDPRIDASIKKTHPFAQPILTHLRALVHSACPGVAETLKWGMPAYTYKGQILSITAGFKKHCDTDAGPQPDAGNNEHSPPHDALHP
jgi:hypothetical protein